MKTLDNIGAMILIAIVIVIALLCIALEWIALEWIVKQLRSPMFRIICCCVAAFVAKVAVVIWIACT